VYAWLTSSRLKLCYHFEQHWSKKRRLMLNKKYLQKDKNSGSWMQTPYS